MRHIAIAVLFLVVSIWKCSANFTLAGNSTLVVQNHQGSGYLNDNSSVDIVHNGIVDHLYSYDSSHTSVSGGYLDNGAFYNSSTLNAINGSVGFIQLFDTSVAVIAETAGGAAYPLNNSKLTLHGGYLNTVQTSDGGSFLLLSGIVYSLYPYGVNGLTEVRGGFVDLLSAGNTGQAILSGGTINQLYAQDSSSISIVGYGFTVDSGMEIIDGKVNGLGSLSGKWTDGTAFSINVLGNWETATIEVMTVPEPSTLAITGLGFCLILFFRRR